MNKRDKKNGRVTSMLRAGAAKIFGGGIKRLGVRCLICLVVLIAVCVGMKLMERGVLTRGGFESKPVRVFLVRQPGWIPKYLANQITASLAAGSDKMNDSALASSIYTKAAMNPWIKTVQYVWKKKSGNRRERIVMVQALYRRPVACVKAGSGYAYVSDDGCRLPAWQVPKNEVISAGPSAGRIVRAHYIMVFGLTRAVPRIGGPWQGDDLADALRLIELVRTRKYFRQITVVDVRNHGGRIDPGGPHLRMYAQAGRGSVTDIRFGQFPIGGGIDYVVPARRKLSYLDDYVKKNRGRLAGVNSYLDLRHDRLHVSVN